MAPKSTGAAAHRFPHPRLESLMVAHGNLPTTAEWDAVEAALYAPNPAALKDHEAAELRYAAVRSSFAYHVQHNAFYRRYCEASGVMPEVVRDPADLSKIPVVPERIFKGCAGPETFVSWLASLSSDEIGWPTPQILSGSYDQQATALLGTHGIQVCTTPGTSGTPSFLPLDPLTRRRSAHWKILTFYSMYPEMLDCADLVSVSLWPLAYQWIDLCVPQTRVHPLIDPHLGLGTVVETITAPAPRGFLNRLLGRKGSNEGEILLARLVAQLKEFAAAGTSTILWTPPFLLFQLARFVQERQLQVEFGAHWRVVTGGGWKFLSEPLLSEPELRRLVNQTFGIPTGQIYDVYDVAECLGLCALSCEGGYKHIPHAVLHPVVLSASMEPLDEGEWGRFAFLNPLITSYPGFIVTEDRARLLGRCPACPRPGPVLDTEISPLQDGGARNCGQIVRNIIEERLES
jgi:Acyl-protein synthetase, LuxE